MLRIGEENTFSLENFEGPLEFLLHLVQKQEVDISTVSLQAIVSQFIERWEKLTDTLDTGAEFVGTTASLLWLKSKMLLPIHEQPTLEEEGIDPRFEIIHQLIDYCRFKELAKGLSILEEKPLPYFYRGMAEIPVVKKVMGIEHLTLQDLSSIFQQMIIQVKESEGIITAEEWKVSDKIKRLIEILKKHSKITLNEWFLPLSGRMDWIVSFLALLEVMKLGEAKIIKEEESVFIVIGEKSGNE